jgi:hypothetical protein
MKRNIFIIALFIIFTVLFRSQIFAVTPVNISQTPNGKNIPGMMGESSPGGIIDQEGSVGQTEYSLPYPGILADHPLFIFKRLRDRILDFLIADPVKKTEFYILQSDKYLAMTLAFVGTEKWDMAKFTADRSVFYMNSAVTKLTELKSGGGDIPLHIIERTEKSLAKHLQVFDEIARKADSANKATYQNFSKLFGDLQVSIGKVK